MYVGKWFYRGVGLSVVKICLSGGLGNQLFQYAFGVSLSRSMEVDKVEMFTSHLSRYATARDYELDPFSSLWEASGKVSLNDRRDLIIDLRLPKVLKRLGLWNREYLRLSAGTYVVDGYFQSVGSFDKVLFRDLLDVISELKKVSVDFGRNELKGFEASGRRLVHIRCTDFYSSVEEAAEAVQARLVTESDDCIIVSDDDDLVERCLENIKVEHGILRTKGWSALEMLSLFRAAKSVSTNGSSLAFWGALLGGQRLETTSLSHQALFQFMLNGEQFTTVK